MEMEFNWFLVIDGFEELKPHSKGYEVIKDGIRIYPIGKSIPLIYKVPGKCVGLIKIVENITTEFETKLRFEIVESFDKLYPIAIHYYEMHSKLKGVVSDENRIITS